LLERDGVAEFDPTRLTVSACGLGLSGFQLETVLRDDYRIAVEAADPLNIVLNVTFGDSQDDVELLVGALRDLSARHADATAADVAACSTLLAHTPPFTRQVLSPRDAVFANAVAKPLAECAGEVSAEMVTPYPPGIPVLGPGELISSEIVAYLREASATGLKVHGPEDRALLTLRVVT
jgi:lysine decarboxylase